ncbi:hypothetical protein AV274_5082 [Blastocystis sp. ATCC 50177/Nand II]|uniref:Uncharacterized protein n=1 Tax=Blastocystis sp. subtype 1 (strain ATCC 50177 / NandII) TaxID=478820 RepID=A0A196SA78_BLAHN|nr:hypothetical protein AV274_5082 [Blastocystis sp. ATCC 50177/Nand II]
MNPTECPEHRGESKIMRRCKQCFAVKPLECYLNKVGNDLCVICDRCRGMQRRRYHVKKALQKKKSTSSEAPSSTANLAYVETIEHSSVQPDCIVPYSKWIVTEPFFHGFQGEDTIPVATLVFHSVMSFSTCPSTPLLRESPTAQDDGVVPMP